MQFQPFKGGGGPDFLSLALNLRQQRNREESQKRRDEAALIRAESQAKNDELSRRIATRWRAHRRRRKRLVRWATSDCSARRNS